MKVKITTKIDINEKAIQMRLTTIFIESIYNLYPKSQDHLNTFKWDFYKSYDKK